MVMFYSVIVLRLYLSFMNATMYPFRYPICLFRILITLCVVTAMIVLVFIFLFLYSVPLALLISGVYQSLFLLLCLLLLILFLKKLSFIVTLPSYSSNQYNRGINIMVKYTVLTLLAMFSGIVVSIFSIVRYVTSSSAISATVLYYIETQFLIIDCLLNIGAIYFQYSFNAVTYYKYLGCLDDFVRFLITCCISRQSVMFGKNGEYAASPNSRVLALNDLTDIGFSPRKTDVNISRHATHTSNNQKHILLSNRPSAMSELTSVSNSARDHKYAQTITKDIKMKFVEQDSGNSSDEFESNSYVRIYTYDD